ncbi:hypothetical protein CL630_02470 [bacterium]|nr:hypothetical protein [bacterium]
MITRKTSIPLYHRAKSKTSETELLTFCVIRNVESSVLHIFYPHFSIYFECLDKVVGHDIM